MKLLIKNGRVVHPITNAVLPQDVLVEDGKITLLEREIEADADRVIDAAGLVVAPGLVDTRMARIRPWEDEIADTLWYRVGQPEDIAYAVAYLASAASDYVTGQVVCPNGGAWM